MFEGKKVQLFRRFELFSARSFSFQLVHENLREYVKKDLNKLGPS